MTARLVMGFLGLAVSLAGGAFSIACSSSTPAEPAIASDAAADAIESTDAPADGGASSDAASDVATPPKRVFLTSNYYLGTAIGGLAKMDEACTQVAAKAKLGGTWRAWASDSHANAIDRLADVGPWFTLAGKKVAENKAGLLVTSLHSLLASIDVTETGQPTTGGGSAWTGTNADGKASADTCNDWTISNDGLAPDGGVLLGQVGTVFATDESWTASTPGQCGASQLSLYCFEQ
ncbi:MAG: hypothetical protein U0235_03515 [Polyangiaceae bacterium]